MARSIRVIGIDPALSNLGLAFGTLDLDHLHLGIDRLELVKTEPTKLKTTRKNSDDLERCRILHQALTNGVQGAEIAFVEMPVGSQSADAMKSYGVCIALIASLQIPVIPVTPKEVKTAAVNDQNATKREMIQWAYERFPSLNWKWSGKGERRRLIDANEHMADAIGAINAGLVNDEFRALVAMLRTFKAA